MRHRAVRTDSIRSFHASLTVHAVSREEALSVAYARPTGSDCWSHPGPSNGADTSLLFTRFSVDVGGSPDSANLSQCRRTPPHRRGSGAGSTAGTGVTCSHE